MIDLSIIIVNYNGSEFLESCFDSIYDKVEDVSFEIIVVDNASKDDSVSVIKNYKKDVLLIESKENLGFAKGNNLGFENSRGQYILLLNNDTVLHTNVRDGIDLINNNDNIRIVGAKMFGKNGEYRFSAGHFPSYKNIYKISNLIKKDSGFSNGSMTNCPHLVDWVEGSFLLTSRKTYKENNGLDPNVFMYGEDVDFCMDSFLKGGKTIYLPNISYTHYGGYNVSRYKHLIEGFRRFNIKYTNNRLERFLFSLSINLNIVLNTINFIIKTKGFDLPFLINRIKLIKFN